METPPALPHEVWAQTPPEAQASIRALEGRVETLTSMVHTLQEQIRAFQEQLHQTKTPPTTTFVYPGGGQVGAVLFNKKFIQPGTVNDTGAITGYADALMAAGQPAEVLKVYQQYSDRLVATDSGKVLESLHALIGHMRELPAAVESLSKAPSRS
jgi:hypothetical protein